MRLQGCARRSTSCQIDWPPLETVEGLPRDGDLADRQCAVLTAASAC